MCAVTIYIQRYFTSIKGDVPSEMEDSEWKRPREKCLGMPQKNNGNRQGSHMHEEVSLKDKQRMGNKGPSWSPRWKKEENGK